MYYSMLAKPGVIRFIIFVYQVFYCSEMSRWFNLAWYFYSDEMGKLSRIFWCQLTTRSHKVFPSTINFIAKYKHTENVKLQMIIQNSFIVICFLLVYYIIFKYRTLINFSSWDKKWVNQYFFWFRVCVLQDALYNRSNECVRTLSSIYACSNCSRIDTLPSSV